MTRSHWCDGFVDWPDYVLNAVRRRGHEPVKTGDFDSVLLPLEIEPPLADGVVESYLDLFGKSSFRKVVRHLLGGHGRPVLLGALEKIAGSSASDYVSFLESIGVATVSAEGITVTRSVDNIGASLEWYVARLCIDELRGSAEWGVKLADLRVGGDFDVLAWLDPVLMYVETKSSRQDEVTDSELKHFLQRGVELAPEMAVLLIDTDDDLSALLARLHRVMLPTMRAAEIIEDPGWPKEMFIRPQQDFSGVSFGFHRYYVTNSDPSILTQLRRCLCHYHAHVKGVSRAESAPVDFVPARVGAEE